MTVKHPLGFVAGDGKTTSDSGGAKIRVCPAKTAQNQRFLRISP
jgi:hypothetical protein